MKRLSFLAVLLLVAHFAFAGGPLTNTNQSAQFIRMLSRNASTDIDAAYFNPAGLTKLNDGWHFAIHSQSIFQDKTINSGFPLLNDPEYTGDVSVPVFPSAYAVYKKDKLALSLNFNPVGGGGSAEYARGLPSFEIPITKIVPALAGLTQIDPALNVTAYDADLEFSGTSLFWGLQLGASYKLNDMFSVFGGVRYMPAKNSYEGSIQNVQLKVAGQNIAAGTWLTQTAGMLSGLAGQASAGAAQFSGTASNLQPIINAGAGGLTLAQLEGAGRIDAATRAQIEGGLQTLGLNDQQIGAMNVTMIQGTFTTAANTLTAQAQELTGTSLMLNGTASQLDDKHVKTTQTGTGITPIFGVNISPNEDWNIGLKYELKTPLELTNDTDVDDLGLFPDGGNSNSDLPAMITAGVGYSGLDWLEAQLSINMYLNTGVEWGQNVRDLAIYKSLDPGKIRNREMDNSYEYALGLQFNVTNNFAVSVGAMKTTTGALDNYQSDFSYNNAIFTLGGGIMWKITDKLVLDAGFSSSMYEDVTVEFTDPDVGKYNETFGKSTINLAAGLSYSIF